MPPLARPSRTRQPGTPPTSVKIVVTGPFGAGKTSLIKTISEIAVLSTERQVTDSTRSLKDQTTVAMDFGRLTIDSELALYLFGTPGQKRFDFMWEILADGMLGFVVLVDAQRADSYDEAREILEFFRDIAQVPYVVALNKSVGNTADATAHAREKLELGDDVPVLSCDARDKDSAKEVLLALLYAVVADIDEATLAATLAVPVAAI